MDKLALISIKRLTIKKQKKLTKDLEILNKLMEDEERNVKESGNIQKYNHYLHFYTLVVDE